MLLRVLKNALSGARRGGRTYAWSYTVTGVIWRIAPAEPGLLVGEARDLEAKTASFFCLDSRTGAPLWEEVVLPGGWWVGIEAICGDVLYAHGFARADLPAHRGITALDLRTGRTLWSSPESEFAGVRPDALLAVRWTALRRELLEIDPRTGAVRNAQPWDDETGELLRRHDDRSCRPEVLLPAPLGKDAPSGRVRDHLRRHWRLEVAESAGWIAHETCDVVIVHEPAAGGEDARMNAVLAVLESRTGELLYRTVLASGLHRPLADACFVWDGMLYFVRERSSCVAYNLSSPT